MIMKENGFDIRREEDGSWTIIDVFSHQAVFHDGHLQKGLTEQQAKFVLDILSRKYAERHNEGGSGRLP